MPVRFPQGLVLGENSASQAFRSKFTTLSIENNYSVLEGREVGKAKLDLKEVVH
jgi:hypothetical protein